jgi:tetratricopeptide (TPR) repeat protein
VTGQQEVDMLLKQGENLFESGDINGAEECFIKILLSNPLHIQALNNIGVIFYLKADFKKAIEYFNETLKIDRLYPEAIENYSKCLIEMGEYTGTLRFLRDSIQMGVNNIEIYNFMGKCFVELNDLKAAKVILKKSLSINPEQHEIKLFLYNIEQNIDTQNDSKFLTESADIHFSNNSSHSKNTENDNFDYISYWNDRYVNGGNSGSGSYGELAQFKADVINQFIKSNNITSTIEFGCGDGNQLSLINYTDYTGFDISEAAVKICKKRYEKDSKKQFFAYSPSDYKNLNIEQADLVVCLDVLYHIIDESDFINTLDAIFTSSKKYVILYTIIETPGQTSAHIKHREISSYIK